MYIVINSAPCHVLSLDGRFPSISAKKCYQNGLFCNIFSSGSMELCASQLFKSFFSNFIVQICFKLKKKNISNNFWYYKKSISVICKRIKNDLVLAAKQCIAMVYFGGAVSKAALLMFPMHESMIKKNKINSHNY